MSDILITVSKQFQYADDIALTFQASLLSVKQPWKPISISSMNFSEELNPSKTESCVFHLNTHEANRQLDVKFTGTEIQHVKHPKYLGVTLDLTLTHNAHLPKTSKKISARINIVQKLAGTGWGVGTETLHTAALAIVYSTAEYCAPVWLNSVHISKIDFQLNNAMRIICK
jgi:hypothetical protein